MDFKVRKKKKGLIIVCFMYKLNPWCIIYRHGRGHKINKQKLVLRRLERELS